MRLTSRRRVGFMPRLRVRAVAALAPLVAGIAITAAVQPQGPTPYTVLLRDERRQLTVRTIGGQEMFALDELAKLFDLTVREDALAGGLTVTARNQTIVLSPGQALA